MTASRGALFTITYVIVATAATGLLGIGGYRAGGILCLLILVVGGCGIAAWCLRRVPQRGVWIAAVALLTLSATGFFVDRAPASKSVLARRMDTLTLPFFTITREVRSGHSWCRPRCPSVTRTYRTPATSDLATMRVITAALYQRHVIRDVQALTRPTQDRYLRVTGPRMIVTVAIDTRGAGQRTVHITYASLRK